MNEELTIRYDATVAEAINKFATAALPLETGGLLLGWWEPDTVVVKYAIEVDDPDATSTTWHRTQARAQQALDQALHHLAHLWLGYVGDWHTHPSPCPPSNTDISAIARASLQFDQPLVLLVYTPSAPGGLVIRAAHHGTSHPARPEQRSRRQRS